MIVRRLGSWVVRVLAVVWLPVVAVVVWQKVTAAKQEPFFPEPLVIWERMKELWFTGPADHLFLNEVATEHWSASLGRMFAGWAVAGVLGVALGVALGRSRLVFDFLDPLLQFGRAMPPPALVPFFISVFKIGTQMQLATIIFGVIWPVLLNSIDGARGVDRVKLDTARSFGMSRWMRLRYLILPAAAPKIFAGLRLSLSLALILMVLSELVGSSDGIGYQLLQAQNEFNVPQMWASIVLLGVLGLVLNAIFLVIERRMLAWHRGSQGHA
ncbi:ABC transporter permease [Spirillospora sp. NPDC048911]|uniref:ABC transporter permease n=1 Tax=Spirillospora sp. NPDC048911 TaxID=3364527 RepID=UPI0037221E76